jgi:NSS family neurotransmitter:Na+ symporter
MAGSDSSQTMWSSRSGFLLAAVGGAVGLGNLWRFPYIAGENGGGGFVLVYLGFVFLIGLPLIAGELLLGRRGRGSAVHSIATLVKSENASPFWNIIGWLSLLIPFIALSYYAVVAAWAVDYLGLAARNVFATLDPATSGEFFAIRVGDPVSQVLLHAAFIATTVWVVAKGLNGGIERMSKILMPSLFGVILILVIYNMFNGAFGEAVDFLFKPDFSELTGTSVLMALGQALFSLAVGVGLMITYAAYMPREYSIRRSATIICLGDTLVALLAGLAIFPIVFANNLDPAGGPGLIFVTLPIAFGQMPGGQVIGALFFILLLFAAYTSAVGMLEPIVSRLEEKWPGRRKLLTPCAGVAIWLAGLGSVLSYGVMADVHPLGFIGIERTFFDLADYAIANVLLPINAFLIAVFAGWIIKRSSADEEFSNSTQVWKSFWRFSNRYVAPVAIAIVLLDLLMGFSA